ncbi:MAG: carbamoyltransferase, partial [Candidatus Aenigmatarchaeota archaeon]
YPSSFNEAAIITSDGVGEWATTTIGFGKENKIEIFNELKYPNSLGLLYSAVTTFLGFRANYDEGKVMGLASYGKPTYLTQFKDMISLKPDGSFKINNDFFRFNQGNKMFSKEFEKIFGKSRNYQETIKKRHKDIAASLQKLVEEILIKITNHLYDKTGTKNLCLAGGTFLNCVANRKIIKNSDFQDVFIQPAAADSGGSLGAALYIYSSIMDKKFRGNIRKDGIYLGPEYSNLNIKRTIIKKGYEYKKMKKSKLITFVAKKLAQNKIIGWFQGRMEFGPRALGNRSILANPENPEMRDIINNKVKHREKFRPFAPSILLEDAERYGINSDVPFMIQSFEVDDKNKDEIISAIHVDGTARPQTVSKGRNRTYHELIKEFKKITGVPALLNTSFNDSGEPIVCTPEDA